MPNEKSVSIGFRVTPEFKRLLAAAARREQRSMTNLLEKLLADHCRSAGLLPSDASAAVTTVAAAPRRAPLKRRSSHQHSLTSTRT